MSLKEKKNTKGAADRSMSDRALDIEKSSFDIIDSEALNHGYNELEWSIVRRVIHATADFDFVKSDCGKIIFHPSAIHSAFAAIKNGCSIVTDVEMVLAGINKKLISDLELRVVCYISDKSLADKAKTLDKTRAEMAMLHAAEEINGGIAVIGNAPTALYELIRMVKEGELKPSLVIGIPVGFVSAAESKRALIQINDVPFITNAGRKGGSAAAASIMNAIMLLYLSLGKSFT